MFVSLALALVGGSALSVPNSAEAMIRRAAAAVTHARDAGNNRQIVRIVVPQLETVRPEDLDPWPGGLAQQYPYAMDLSRELLGGVVGTDASLRDQVLDAQDACGLLTAEAAKPDDDCALVLFCGCDQMDQLDNVEAMAQGRLVVLVNPQFRRIQDFGLMQRTRAQPLLDRYTVSYAFEEFACRGEDVKLVYEAGAGWKAHVLLDDTDILGEPLNQTPLEERPTYEWIEKAINEKFPTPRWARKLDDFDAQGPAFLRK